MLRVTTAQQQWASWRSLLRTTRAPVSVIAIAGLSLVLPSQTGDELTALREISVGPFSALLIVHFSLGLLALSGWYWSRAALSARFGVNDSLEARSELRRCSRRTFNAIPRIVFLCGVALSLLLLWRGFSGFQCVALALWAVPAYLLIHWRLEMTRPRRRQARVHLERLYSRRGLWPWLTTVWPRVRAIVMLAPFSPIVAGTALFIAVGMFTWGAFESFLSLGPDYPGLPAIVADFFPGPSSALIGLALAIGPLTVLIFVTDGLRLEWDVLGRAAGFSRPPVMSAVLLWIVFAPMLFSLHTVRVLTPARGDVTVDDRRSLDDLFDTWANVCATDTKAPARPIVVAISGGASRAGIWGARMLGALEAAETHNAAVFAVSSVSGGSLGAAAYMAIKRGETPLCSGPGSSEAPIAEQLARVNNEYLGGDVLGPLLAGSMLSDLPRSLFSPIEASIRWAIGAAPRGGDRAEAVERAFEHLWSLDLQQAKLDGSPIPRFSAGFLSLFYHNDGSIRAGMPVWVLNGTDVTSGGRMLTVPFGAKEGMSWPFYASSDLLGILQADVPISTAINNSARFPYLEPSGEIVSAKAPPRQLHTGSPEVLDGGIFDNEGLETALELAQWLKHRTVNGQPVQPIIVLVTANADIDVAVANNVVRCPNAPIDIPSEPPLPPETLQLLAPIMGIYNVRAAHTALVLRRTRDEFCGGHERSFFHFYLFSNPEHDIPLNWMLSKPAVAAIKEQADSRGNAAELACLRKVLKEGGQCDGTATAYRARGEPPAEPRN